MPEGSGTIVSPGIQQSIKHREHKGKKVIFYHDTEKPLINKDKKNDKQSTNLQVEGRLEYSSQLFSYLQTTIHETPCFITSKRC